MKTLIIVDMQRDFITGSLANKDAQDIVPGICDLVKNFDGGIICTLDTHSFDYMKTQEGHYLPVEHCIKGTDGWSLDSTIYQTVKEYANNFSNQKPYLRDVYREAPVNFLEKGTFGSLDWNYNTFISKSDEIILVGTCTSICVLANAIILKTLYPEIKISVISNLCADINKESHLAALTVMKNLQINIL